MIYFRVDNILRHGRIQPREVSGQLKFYFGETSFDTIKDIVELPDVLLMMLLTT